MMHTFVLVTMLLVTSDATGATLPPARDVLVAIERKGASTVLLQMYDDSDRWVLLMDSIATGQTDWLRVGVLLGAVADAGASEEIESAFSRALAVAPERVLPLLTQPDHKSPNLFAVCSGVMLAEDRDEKGMRAWAKEVENALRSARPATHAGRQNQEMCLDTLLTEFPKLKFH